jgi:hypothetical protein
MLLGQAYSSTTNTLLGTNFSSATSIPLGGGARSNQSDFIALASNADGQLVAAASGGLYFSNDGIGWTAHSEPGYFFRSVIWFNDHWVAGAYSNLTKYTYWTSTNGTAWLPWNNGVQMYGMFGSNSITVSGAGSNLLIAQSASM